MTKVLSAEEELWDACGITATPIWFGTATGFAGRVVLSGFSTAPTSRALSGISGVTFIAAGDARIQHGEIKRINV